MNSFAQQVDKANFTLTWKGVPRKYLQYKLIQPFEDELGDTLGSRPEIIEKRLELGYTQANKILINNKI